MCVKVRYSPLILLFLSPLSLPPVAVFMAASSYARHASTGLGRVRRVRALVQCFLPARNRERRDLDVLRAVDRRPRALGREAARCAGQPTLFLEVLLSGGERERERERETLTRRGRDRVGVARRRPAHADVVLGARRRDRPAGERHPRRRGLLNVLGRRGCRAVVWFWVVREVSDAAGYSCRGWGSLMLFTNLRPVRRPQTRRPLVENESCILSRGVRACV